MNFATALLTVLALAALAAAASPDRKVLFNRSLFPLTYRKIGEAHPDQSVEFLIALRQRNLDVLEKTFWSVSDPASAQYGKYLSIEEILDIVAPPASVQATVVDWLKEYGITRIEPRGDAVHFQTKVSVAAQLFQTKLFNFVDHYGHVVTRQLGEYSLPVEMDPHIEFVAGLSEFPMPRRSSRRSLALNATDAMVVPETISTLYNIQLDADTKVSQGVIEFQNDASYNKQDLATFYKQMGITTTPITNVVGPYNGQYPDTEASLDIQYVTAVGVDATNWYWTATNWMFDFANNFFSTKDVPQVVSMSWGWSETAQCSIDTDCSTLGIDSQTYVSRVDVEFQKIGLRGTTLVASSGDSGANGRTDPYCSDSTLHAVFPASSPYVTAVGATQLTNEQTALKNPPPICSQYTCASGGVETAVSFDVASFTSGGGFSQYHTSPSYQTSVVGAYLKSGVALPPSTYYNATGRAYPDIAALGHNFLCYISGQDTPVGGTSASSPTIAGILAILNSVRAKLGQPSIGFANPFLYKMHAEHPAAFTDITVGDNICTEYGCASSCKGFKAFKGWDPVTGLGTPNVAEMINYVKAQKL